MPEWFTEKRVSTFWLPPIITIDVEWSYSVLAESIAYGAGIWLAIDYLKDLVGR